MTQTIPWDAGKRNGLDDSQTDDNWRGGLDSPYADGTPEYREYMDGYSRGFEQRVLPLLAPRMDPTRHTGTRWTMLHLRVVAAWRRMKAITVGAYLESRAVRRAERSS